MTQLKEKWRFCMFTIVTEQNKADVKLFSKRIKRKNIKQSSIGFSLIELKRPACLKNQKLLAEIGNSRVILSNSLSEYADKQFHFADEAVYSFKLMQNGVEYLLSKNAPLQRQLSVTLIDIQCRYQGLADILLRYFNTIRIVTNRKQLYQNYVDTKLYDCGAAVTIDNSIKSLHNTALFVSPDGILFDKMNQSSAVIISVRNIANAKAVVLHSFRTQTPSKYLELLPVGICEHSYQSALYHYCGIRNLSALYPTKVTVSSIEKAIDEIVLFPKERVP